MHESFYSYDLVSKLLTLTEFCCRIQQDYVYVPGIFRGSLAASCFSPWLFWEPLYPVLGKSESVKWLRFILLAEVERICMEAVSRTDAHLFQYSLTLEHSYLKKKKHISHIYCFQKAFKFYHRNDLGRSKSVFFASEIPLLWVTNPLFALSCEVSVSLVGASMYLNIIISSEDWAMCLPKQQW